MCFKMEKLQLLIVDDEQDIRDLSEGIIQRAFDLVIRKVGTIKEAEAAILVTPPDLVLLDLNLPDGIGFDLVPSLKAGNEKVVFTIVTAYNHCKEKQKAKELGASSFLEKPFKSSDLSERVAKMIEELKQHG